MRRVGAFVLFLLSAIIIGISVNAILTQLSPVSEGENFQPAAPFAFMRPSDKITPDEQELSELTIKKMRTEFDEKLKTRMQAFAAEQTKQNSGSSFYKTVIADIIVPLIGAVAGLVGAIVSLVVAFRGKPAKG